MNFIFFYLNFFLILIFFKKISKITEIFIFNNFLNKFSFQVQFRFKSSIKMTKNKNKRPKIVTRFVNFPRIFYFFCFNFSFDFHFWPFSLSVNNFLHFSFVLRNFFRLLTLFACQFNLELLSILRWTTSGDCWRVNETANELLCIFFNFFSFIFFASFKLFDVQNFFCQFFDNFQFFFLNLIF